MGVLIFNHDEERKILDTSLHYSSNMIIRLNEDGHTFTILKDRFGRFIRNDNYALEDLHGIVKECYNV